MIFVLTRRMFFAGGWHEPGEYVIGREISRTDMKCAIVDGYGHIATDSRKTDAPENKLLGGTGTAPENKVPLESGDRGGAGSEPDAGSSEPNPLLSDTARNRKQRASKDAKR